MLRRFGLFHMALSRYVRETCQQCCTFGFNDILSLKLSGRDCHVEPGLFKSVTKYVFLVYGSHYTLHLGICQPLRCAW